jgi:hypothetical protein
MCSNNDQARFLFYSKKQHLWIISETLRRKEKYIGMGEETILGEMVNPLNVNLPKSQLTKKSTRT